MSDLNDMDEFIQATSTAESSDDGNIPQGPLSPTPTARPKDEEIHVGAITQYSLCGGNGYTPSTDSVKQLPADCYRIVITQNGMLIFERQHLTTDDLMRLPDSKSDEVIMEVEKFWTLKHKFLQYGFSHKRGYLLWGPPGSGKTSTLSIIVSDMIKAGGVVFLARQPESLALGLAKFREIEPERPLVVIWEDIDSIIDYYGESEVLSILDGESQVENVVFIATTNYPEKLDGRIVNRPSRFDRIVKIGMPNAAARKMYLAHKIGPNLVIDGVDVVKETDGLSIAHLRELIVAVFCQGNTVHETLERLKRMRVLPKSTGDGGPLGIA